ncbi:hypothetical protein ACFX10_012015 [Malus domestica]
MVRGSDRPELRLQRSINNEAPNRKDTSGVTDGVFGSHARDNKKWRMVQRQDCPASQIQVVVPQLRRQLRWECGDGSFPEADFGTPSDGDVEGFTGSLDCNSRQCSSLLRHVVGSIKRGGESSSIDLVQSLQKKNRGPSTDADRQGIQDGTVEASDLWDHVEAASGENGSRGLTVCASNLARGGGGWPSTAARSP